MNRTSYRFALGTTLAIAALALNPLTVQAQGLFITEWMYAGDEFFELTNTSASPIDLTGWSYDDDSRTPGVVSLSSFGVVAPGESVIVAEVPAGEFRTRWGLSAVVKILGGNTTNLGRNDEINIFDNNNALVDRLTFGDQNIPGTIRTQNISGFTTPEFYGTNDVSRWQLSVVGDVLNSQQSATGGFVANPGRALLPQGNATAPEPGTLALLALGSMAFVVVRRRK